MDTPKNDAKSSMLVIDKKSICAPRMPNKFLLRYSAKNIKAYSKRHDNLAPSNPLPSRNVDKFVRH